ncbi:MAG: hypothetical protein K2H02_00235 [Anaeroplasmataceae bacterium]|nr:hypothetical protein [Anaeroplasmataceae bacterium]MDE5867352.1 hypothetical protein [Anaeroplasmataceae bacterium]
MTKILGHTGNAVYLGHFQGNAMKHFLDIVEEYSMNKVTISPRVSVITNYTQKEQAITALQLELSNMPYVNACPEETQKWSNVNKIKNYVDALEKTTSEYSLLVDGYDVLFFRDIDDEFIERFNEINKKILFNATKNNHPNFDIDFVEQRDDLGEFKYLNAGVVFGRTEDLLSFYKEVLELTQKDNIMNPWQSEQLYVRMAANGKEDIAFDYECNLFQTFSKANKTICGNTVIIY